MPTPILVWYRNDLRVRDHHPLREAARAGGPVVPVYVLDPREFALLPEGWRKTGPHRARFLLESVAALREETAALGAPLVVRVGHPEEILPRLAREAGAAAIHFHEEAASDEVAVEDALEEACGALGVAVRGWWGSTLHHPDDLPFDLDGLPDVFTAFRRRVEAAGTLRPLVEAPAALGAHGIDPGPLPALASLGMTPAPDEPRTPFRWRGGAAAARDRMQRWMWDADRLRRYKESRNGLLAADDMSRLSPWLAHGCLSPREVVEAVRRVEDARGANESTYWLVFELLWRDFFRFVAARAGDTLFRAAGPAGRALPWSRAMDQLARWREGRTGFPLVDAAMRELAATGWMSNRARQNAASFLANTLGIDWRLGASWFEHHLIDYDAASNWGNWTYVAGVGNDPRGFRVFDVRKQARDYDPAGAYVRHWLPALAPLHGADALEPWRHGADHPPRMVDLDAASARREALWRRSEAGRAARARR